MQFFTSVFDYLLATCRSKGKFIISDMHVIVSACYISETVCISNSDYAQGTKAVNLTKISTLFIIYDFLDYVPVT
jgi:hypothetical protein